MFAIRSALLLGLSFSLGLCGVEYVRSLENDAAEDSQVGTLEYTMIDKSDSSNTVATPVSASQSLSSDAGWRRTDQGWVQTADWSVSSSRTDQAHATQIHPSLIAAFVILASLGALLAFDPVLRRHCELVKSDRSLIQDWARQLRDRAKTNRPDCL